MGEDTPRPWYPGNRVECMSIEWACFSLSDERINENVADTARWICVCKMTALQIVRWSFAQAVDDGEKNAARSHTALCAAGWGNVSLEGRGEWRNGLSNFFIFFFFARLFSMYFVFFLRKFETFLHDEK